ncbi:U-box domain-containing protein 15-like, partial [Phalaenopsis equestris]|uniref:U-box domain-containing protein 15-like n=1 Tax=Phalaenopsis equestris TaxID=78828 RepID=UPI0009E6578D
MEKVSDPSRFGEVANAADGGGQGGGEEESEMDVDDLVRELLETFETVLSFSDYRRTQKKECYNLIRRMKLVVPLLEEIRDSEVPVPDGVCSKLCSLRAAFKAAKKLLRCCHDGSKIYLALESEAVMGRFHFVNEKLTQAVEDMPYNGLYISDEAKEQVFVMFIVFFGFQLPF